MADENAVPEAVQEQAAAAEKALADARKAEADAAEAVVEAEKTPEVEPEAPAETPVEAEPEAEAESVEEPVAEVAEEPQADLAAELERLRHSHAVLAGKYSAEVPLLHKQLRTKAAAIGQLKGELKAARKAAKEEAPVDPVNPYALSEDERELGPEVATLAEKIANRVIASKTKDLDERIQKLAEKEDGEDFWDTLIGLVPNYGKINGNARFQQWLLEPDPLSGILRDELLKAAQTNGDGNAAARILLAWETTQADTAAPTPSRKSTRPSIAAQVAPKTVAAAQAKAKGKVYTLQEYETLMTRVAKKEFTPKRTREVMAELDKAVRDGRVR